MANLDTLLDQLESAARTGINTYCNASRAAIHRLVPKPDPEPIPTPTNFDQAEALETVWACLERLPDDALTDDDRDNLNTAMAWLNPDLEGVET